MDFRTRDWSRKAVPVVQLREFVHEVYKIYSFELNGWDEPILEGCLRQDQDLGWDSVYNYSAEMAAREVCVALSTGKLKGFIEGAKASFPFELPSEYWRLPEDGRLNIESVISGKLTDNPFGSDVRTDFSTLSKEGAMIFLRIDRGETWKKESLKKIKAPLVPDWVLVDWYKSWKEHDPEFYSLVELRDTAMRVLKMPVSEAQIDRMTADEDRPRGRRPGS